MRPRPQASPAISLIDTAQFRKLVQIDMRHGTSIAESKGDDDLAKTDKIRTLNVPELADEVDENPGFDPYNSVNV